MRKPLLGVRFGRLVVECLGKLDGRNRYVWCRCDCGNRKEIAVASLRRGKSNSCGCLNSELASERRRTHGQSKGATYHTWIGMKQRCYAPTNPAYAHYGARGITVCERWLLSYETFVEDMGLRPSGCSLDRIDNDGPYSPENCRWATAKAQALNRRSNQRYDLNGQRLTIREIADVTGIPYQRLRSRLVDLRWTVERAVTQPA